MFLQLLGFAIQGIQGTANTNIWPVLISSPNSELGPLGNGKTPNYVQQIQHQITIAADFCSSYIRFTTNTLNWFNKIWNYKYTYSGNMLWPLPREQAATECILWLFLGLGKTHKDSKYLKNEAFLASNKIPSPVHIKHTTNGFTHLRVPERGYFIQLLME